MEIMIIGAARIVLYALTFACIVLFVVSVRKEPRRMLNCVLLVASLALLWESIIIAAAYELVIDVSGIATLPAMLIAALFASFLIFNGFDVLRKEGTSLSHALPLLSGIAIVLFLLAYLASILYFGTIGIEQNNISSMVRDAIFSFIFGLVLYLPGMVIGFILYSLLYQHLPKPQNIILWSF